MYSKKSMSVLALCLSSFLLSGCDHLGSGYSHSEHNKFSEQPRVWRETSYSRPVYLAKGGDAALKIEASRLRREAIDARNAGDMRKAWGLEEEAEKLESDKTSSHSDAALKIEASLLRREAIDARNARDMRKAWRLEEEAEKLEKR